MQGIKLIVTDLDNTLLRRDKTVSSYTFDVFRRMRELGILLAFATARDFRFVTEHLAPLTGIKPDILIADNGALARYNDRDLYLRMIPYTTVNILMSTFERVRCVSTERALYLSSEYSSNHWSVGKKATVITDFSNCIDSAALFLAGKFGKLSQSLIDSYHDIRVVKYSDVDSMTVVHREATKLDALFAVGRALDIAINDIAVFGDDYSDIEMLSYYKHSIAVANAIDECKSAANYVSCDCDEDGVAKWIEVNVL